MGMATPSSVSIRSTVDLRRKNKSTTGPKTPTLPTNREGSGTQFNTFGEKTSQLRGRKPRPLPQTGKDREPTANPRKRLSHPPPKTAISRTSLDRPSIYMQRDGKVKNAGRLPALRG